MASIDPSCFHRKPGDGLPNFLTSAACPGSPASASAASLIKRKPILRHPQIPGRRPVGEGRRLLDRSTPAPSG